MNLKKLQNIITEIRHVIGKDKEVERLAEVISGIKVAFEDHWQEEHLPYAQKLIDNINKGIPTPVLTVCGRGTQEIRYTKYLAYYLDPSNNHGLGSKLLKAVFEPYAKGLHQNWAEECQVLSELWIGDFSGYRGKTRGCYCDIGIMGKGFGFIIEQKILSSEDTDSQAGLSQLIRYSIVLDENPEYKNRDVFKIYLTPTGRLPEKARELGWFSLSYMQVIERIYKVFISGTLTATARENLSRLLMDLIIGPYKKSEELLEEIQQASARILDGSFNLLAIVKFRRLIEDNRLLINIISGGA